MASFILPSRKQRSAHKAPIVLRRTRWRSAECLEHRLGLLLLCRIAFFHHFLQQLAGPVLVTHLFVRLGEIELGRDFLPSRVRSAARTVAAAGRTEIQTDGGQIHGGRSGYLGLLFTAARGCSKVEIN